jgi:hypothetical protein
MRLMDFQACVRVDGFSQEQQKASNEAFFPVYEAVRSWLKEHELEAPFQKIILPLLPRPLPSGGMDRRSWR